MRHTFGQLVQTSKNYCIEDKASTTTGLSDPQTFIKNEINVTVSEIFSKIRDWEVQPLPLTGATVADQTYYHLPPMTLSVESVTITVGSVVRPLVPVTSQKQWDHLQSVTNVTSNYPQYYFVRQHDVGIYPTPSSANVMTTVINVHPYKMSSDDYTSGTVSATQGSVTLTGTDTTFTSSMVGRWIYLNTPKVWQRISGYTSATELSLETTFIDTSFTGSTFIIGESPELPADLHDLIPYRVAAIFYATSRKDMEQSQGMLNYFYTGDFNNRYRVGQINGGLLGILNRYKVLGRGNTQLIDNNVRIRNFFDERFKTTLS